MQTRSQQTVIIMSDLRFTTSEFERACSLLPEGTCWGEHLTVEIVLHIEQASRRAAMEEAIQIIETHRVPVGNSAAGEMAAGWTMDALHEIRDAIRAREIGDDHE
jgi:hypothetical protein